MAVIRGLFVMFFANVFADLQYTVTEQVINHGVNFITTWAVGVKNQASNQKLFSIFFIIFFNKEIIITLIICHVVIT